MRNKGEGSIYRRAQDGMWCATVELPPLDGKRRRKTLVAKTKADILGKLARTKTELERSGDIPTASQTLETWLTYWLDKVAAKRVRPSTLYTYRRQLEVQVIPVLGKTRLDKLTSAHIRRLHDHMADQGLSSTYALTTHRLLSKALTDAVREGRVGRNVATLVDAPKLGQSDGEALTVDEAITVLDYARASLESDAYDPGPVLWATYLLTGIRRSELLALEWDRVSDVIDLSWQLQQRHERHHRTTTPDGEAVPDTSEVEIGLAHHPPGGPVEVDPRGAPEAFTVEPVRSGVRACGWSTDRTVTS